MGNIMKSIQIRFGVILSIIFTIISCEKEERPLVTAITIDSPVMYETVNGIIDISILVSSDIDIFKVELWVDSVNTGLFDDSEPYTISLNTEEYDDGLTSLFIRAYSSTRNVGDSDPILVEINNHPDFEVFTNNNSPIDHQGVRYFDISDNGVIWANDIRYNTFYRFENEVWDVFEIPETFGVDMDIDAIAINIDTVWAGVYDPVGLMKIIDDNITIYQMDSLDFYYIYRIAVDRTNQVWAASPWGKIIRFNGHKFDVWSPSDHWSDSTHMFYWDDGPIQGIEVDEDNKIWFAGYSDYLGNILASYSNDNWEIFSGPDVGERYLNGFTLDNNNNKWICLYNYGIAKLSNDLTWTVYDTTNSNIPGVEFSDIHSDRDGSIWIATYNIGIISFEQNTNNWSVYNSENSEQVFSFIHTIKGTGKVLWAGTNTFGGFPNGLGGLVRIKVP